MPVPVTGMSQNSIIITNATAAAPEDATLLSLTIFDFLDIDANIGQPARSHYLLPPRSIPVTHYDSPYRAAEIAADSTAFTTRRAALRLTFAHFVVWHVYSTGQPPSRVVEALLYHAPLSAPSALATPARPS